MAEPLTNAQLKVTHRDSALHGDMLADQGEKRPTSAARRPSTSQAAPTRHQEVYSATNSRYHAGRSGRGVSGGLRHRAPFRRDNIETLCNKPNPPPNRTMRQVPRRASAPARAHLQLHRAAIHDTPPPSRPPSTGYSFCQVASCRRGRSQVKLGVGHLVASFPRIPRSPWRCGPAASLRSQHLTARVSDFLLDLFLNLLG